MYHISSSKVSLELHTLIEIIHRAQNLLFQNAKLAFGKMAEAGCSLSDILLFSLETSNKMLIREVPTLHAEDRNILTSEDTGTQKI
jgi:hypothetical protein